MAASNGRAVLIDKNGTALADELRAKNININGELIDITTSGDGGWTTTLADEFGEVNVTLAIDGILKTDTLSDMAFDGAQDTFTVIIDDLFQLTGIWQFQSGFSIGAPYNDATTFSGTLQSSGTVTKTAVP